LDTIISGLLSEQAQHKTGESVEAG